MIPLPARLDRHKEIAFLTTRRFHWALVLSCSIFMVLFLVLFLPFGVNEPRKEFNLLFIAQLSLFGGIIFFTLLSNEFLLRRKIKRKWTPAFFLVWVGWTFFSSGTMNFLLYNFLQDWYDMHWRSYVLHVINVSTVEIFPIVGVFFYFRHQEMKQQLRQLGKGSEYPDILRTPLSFSGSSERERITLELQQILYIESDDNYVILHYLENGNKKKHMMRSTLSALETADYPYDFLMRIHRSFLINAYMVETLRGNVQKSELKLRYLDNFFPVSRSYIHAVRDRLRAL